MSLYDGFRRKSRHPTSTFVHVARKWFVLLAEDDVRDSTKGAMMCPSPCLALSEDRPESRVTKIPDPKDPCSFNNHLGF